MLEPPARPGRGPDDRRGGSRLGTHGLRTAVAARPHPAVADRHLPGCPCFPGRAGQTAPTARRAAHRQPAAGAATEVGFNRRRLPTPAHAVRRARSSAGQAPPGGTSVAHDVTLKPLAGGVPAVPPAAAAPGQAPIPGGDCWPAQPAPRPASTTRTCGSQSGAEASTTTTSYPRPRARHASGPPGTARSCRAARRSPGTPAGRADAATPTATPTPRPARPAEFTWPTSANASMPTTCRSTTPRRPSSAQPRRPAAARGTGRQCALRLGVGL